MLIHFGVVPYLVFDGDYLPSKAITEVERAKKRAESRRIGLELHRMGKISQAHLELQKAVDVTPEMARQLIDELNRHKVQFVVAPYEADAQLVYLERKGLIQAIISEDSDLLVFGAKRLLTKLDQYGDCFEIKRKDFTACKEISLVGWSDAEFRRMAILSGCDYLANINKMGLKTAYRLVRKYKSIEKIIRILQFDGQYRIPLEYLENFRKAELTFLHQRVFCPIDNKLVMTTDLGGGVEPEDFAFIGKDVEINVACGVANGDLHPMTKQPLTVPSKSQRNLKSPWTTSRTQSIGTPSDTKPKNPIDSFFKPQRTPLAELDPNSMTPSPSQRRLLEQHTGSWLSSSAPALMASSRSNRSLTSSVHALESRTANQRVANHAAVATPALHPPKRQRLCEDEESSAASRVEDGRSRFFAPATEPSPSIKQKPKTRAKNKGADINIWSDDSIEDAMVSLADDAVSCQPSRAKSKVAIFRDDEVVSTPVTDGTRVSMSPSPGITSFATDVSQSTIIGTPLSSLSSFRDSQPLAQSVTIEARSELKLLSEQFSYTPDSVRAVHCASLSSSRADQLDRPHERAVKPALLRHQTLKSLQKVGGRALRRSKSYDQSVSTSLEDGGDSAPLMRTEDRHLDVPRSPETASKPPGPITNGSEDFLVPNSEDDSDQQDSDGEGVTKGPKVDLSKFAFKA